MSAPDLDAIMMSDCRKHPFPLAKELRRPECQIVVRQSVINHIREHAYSNISQEICGVLVGIPAVDEQGPFIYVTASIRGKYANNEIGNVTFTAKTWSYVQAEMERHYPDQRMAGWYHTHPDFGVFLSNMDLFIHGNFFNLPWQLAYVMDPVRGKDGWFAWHAGEPVLVDVLIEPDRPSRCFSPASTTPEPVGNPSQESARLQEWIRLLEQQRIYLAVGFMVILILGLIMLLRSMPHERHDKDSLVPYGTHGNGHILDDALRFNGTSGNTAKGE